IVLPEPSITTLSPPAMGSNLKFKTEADKLTQLLSFYFLVETDANVADRGINIIMSKGGAQFFRCLARTSHPASTVVRYCFAFPPGDSSPITTFQSAALPLLLLPQETTVEI